VTTPVLPPARPTDGLRPTWTQVAAVIASRGARPGQPQFSTTTRPTDAQVTTIVDLVAADVDAEADGHTLRSGTLQTLATLLVTLAAAATVELTFFPEQESSGAGAILWARYQASLIRFRVLLAREGGGPPTARSTRTASATVAAAQRLFPNDGTVVNGAWIANGELLAPPTGEVETGYSNAWW